MAKGNHERPRVMYDGKHYYVARLVCEEAYGPPPTSKHEAAHKRYCNNDFCINPEHVYWATRSENELDKRPDAMKCIQKHGDQFMVRMGRKHNKKYVGVYSTIEEAMDARNKAME